MISMFLSQLKIMDNLKFKKNYFNIYVKDSIAKPIENLRSSYKNLQSDTYKSKYYKYKKKYLNLKDELNKGSFLHGGEGDIVEESNIILFMFLGGLPNETSEIGQHWKKIFECSNNKNKFYAIVHPMRLSNTTVTPFWQNLFSNNILIVDNDHHVGTKWATRSLVDATILMMQYARSNINNIKKYVLLSSSCVPLFKLDDLYYAFVKDNKSWLQSKSEDNGVRGHLKYALKVSGGLFDLYDSNFFSQWMALDKIHVNLFFINDINPTYIVEKDNSNNKKVYCGQTNKIIVNNIITDSIKKRELNKLLQSFESTHNPVNTINDLLNPCVPTDEHFFGMFIYYKLLKNQNENDYLEILKNNITAQTYTNVVQKLIYLKKFSNNLERLFYTDNVNIFCEIANNDGYNDNLFTFTDNLQHVFTPLNYSLNLTKKESIRYSTNVNLPGHNKVFLKNNNGNIDLEDTRLDFEKSGFAPNIKANFYPVSSTYTNWDNWSPDPRNVLRGLNLNNQFNLNGFLTLQPIDAIQFLNNINIPNSYNDLHIKMPMWHPLEYTEWTLNEIINAYIIMGYLKDILLQPENNWPQNVFKFAYDKYKNLICEYFNNYNEVVLNVSDNINIQFLECLNQNLLETFDFNQVKIGNYIYPETITSAISSGALFIRKAGNNCGIIKYTDWICNSLSYKDIQDYSCKIENCCVIKGINKIFSSIGSNGIGSNGIGSNGIGSTGIGSNGIGSTGIGSSQNTNISGFLPKKTKNMIDILSTLSKTVDIKETVMKNKNNFEKLLKELLFINNLEYNQKYLELKNIKFKNHTSNFKKIPDVSNYIEWDYIDYFVGKINDSNVDIYNEIIEKFKKWLFDNKLVKMKENNGKIELKFTDKYIKRIFYKYLFSNEKVAILFYKLYLDSQKLKN